MVLKISREDWGVQARLGVVEEGLLLGGRDGVQAAERQAEQAIGLRLRGEGAGDGGGDLDGLAGHGQTTNGNLVGVDLSAGGGTVTVGDAPGGTAQELGGAALGGVVDGLAVDLAGGGRAGEDPQVRGTGVKVQVQGLGRGADLDGGDVGIVEGVDGGGAGRASGATLETELSRDVGNGSLEPVRHGLAILEVGLLDGQSTVELVVGVADLLEGGLARAQVVGGVGRGSNVEARRSAHGGAGESCCHKGGLHERCHCDVWKDGVVGRKGHNQDGTRQTSTEAKRLGPTMVRAKEQMQRAGDESSHTKRSTGLACIFISFGVGVCVGVEGGFSPPSMTLNTTQHHRTSQAPVARSDWARVPAMPSRESP